MRRRGLSSRGRRRTVARVRDQWHRRRWPWRGRAASLPGLTHDPGRRPRRPAGIRGPGRLHVSLSALLAEQGLARIPPREWIESALRWPPFPQWHLAHRSCV